MKAHLDIFHTRIPFVHYAFPPQGDEEGFRAGGSAGGHELKTKTDALRILDELLSSVEDGLLPQFTLTDVVNELELKQNDQLQPLIDRLKAGRSDSNNLSFLRELLDKTTTQLEIDSLLEAVVEAADVLEDTPLFEEKK